jgi:hypothetical protein
MNCEEICHRAVRWLVAGVDKTSRDGAVIGFGYRVTSDERLGGVYSEQKIRVGLKRMATSRLRVE